MVDWTQLFQAQFRIIVAVLIVIVGAVAGYLLGRLNERLLTGLGVGGAIEGTSLERTARNFGTSSVTVLARTTSWLVYLVAIVFALDFAAIVPMSLLGAWLVEFLPRIVLAFLAIVVGIVAGDKAELLVSERLRGVKVPEISIVPRVIKFSIVFIALLVALGQLGVATGALLLLFAAYTIAIIAFSVVALRYLLASAAAGIYLLLHEPFSIGDEVSIDEHQGIVQEVDLFVTHVEAEGTEYIVPNHLVMRDGAALIRE
jgi:hypothetical protein